MTSPRGARLSANSTRPPSGDGCSRASVAGQRLCRVYCGNLPPQFHNNKIALEQYFSRYGAVQSCTTGSSGGPDGETRFYGFVQFSSGAAADAAVLDEQGRRSGGMAGVKCTYAKIRANATGNSLDAIPLPIPPEVADPCKVFIAGFSGGETDESLGDFFSQWGLVNLVQIVYNRETKQSKGFGFVLFACKEGPLRLLSEVLQNDEEHSHPALRNNLPHLWLHGRKVDVKYRVLKEGGPAAQAHSVDESMKTQYTSRALQRHLGRTAAANRALQDQQQQQAVAVAQYQQVQTTQGTLEQAQPQAQTPAYYTQGQTVLIQPQQQLQPQPQIQQQLPPQSQQSIGQYTIVQPQLHQIHQQQLPQQPNNPIMQTQHSSSQGYGPQIYATPQPQQQLAPQPAIAQQSQGYAQQHTIGGAPGYGLAAQPQAQIQFQPQQQVISQVGTVSYGGYYQQQPQQQPRQQQQPQQQPLSGSVGYYSQILPLQPQQQPQPQAIYAQPQQATMQSAGGYQTHSGGPQSRGQYQPQRSSYLTRPY